MYPMFQKYFPAIQHLPTHRKLYKSDLFVLSFLIEEEGHIEMYYAPHNEYVNREAAVVMVGITPGWNQMKTAYEQLLKSLTKQHNVNNALKEVKKIASFSGSTRKNLISMLDMCGLHEVLRVKSTEILFEEKRSMIHTTSIIKYPVFNQEKNYTGHKPNIEKSALLTHYAFHVFPDELRKIKNPALIIPLGKVVENVLKKLEKEEEGLQKHTYLYGFPHPSGANGHRMKQLNQRKQLFISIIKQWSQTDFI